LLVDARSIPHGTTIEAEVCIVGAGAAGITLALELAGLPLRVCLLESGGLEPDPPSQALARGLVYGRPYFSLDSTRTRRFGGSTSCWHGTSRPLDAIDFEARDWVPHSGWPFGPEELRPHYPRAQEICRLERFAYDAAAWADADRPLLPFQGGEIETRVYQVAATRFGEVHREAVARAENLHTYLFANAIELVTDEHARVVERVRVACLDGNAFAVRARVFILATGGIENARLLLASNRVEGAGLGNRHDRVGRFFMEHLHLISGALLPSRSDPPLALYRGVPHGRASLVGFLTAAERTLRLERLLSFAAFLGEEAPLPAFEDALARNIHEMDARPGEPAGRVVFLMNQSEQAPNPASRVRLVEERDALGMPRVQLEWRLGSLDKLSLRRSHEILARELALSGLGRFQLMLSADPRDWPPELGGGRHHMGTTRMHVDPKQGVVDANARVHGTANLYVAGSSVFPTSGSASPTLTLVALAVRLADRIKKLLR
jgi:choline dehydrogenase-like flavoprotein